MKDFLYNAKKQFILILTLLLLYWGWEIFIKDHGHYEVEYSKVEVRPEAEKMIDADSVIVELPSLQDTLITEEDATISRVEILEKRLEFWDMILGHLSSILTSLAALLVPVITYFNTRRRADE